MDRAAPNATPHYSRYPRRRANARGPGGL